MIRPNFKVVGVSDYYGGSGEATGGAGASALRIASVLEKSGLLDGVVVGFGDLPTPDKIPGAISLGGEDLRERSKQSRVALLHGLWNSTAAHRLRAALRDRDYKSTVVCLHQWTRYLSPAALAEISRFRHIVYVHDYFWMCPNGAYFEFPENKTCNRTPMSTDCLKARCDRAGYLEKAFRVVRHVLKDQASSSGNARRIFVHISEKSRCLMLPFYPKDRHFVLYHSMDLDHPRLTSPLSSRATYDIGYFGRLEPEKGVVELAESAREVGMSLLVVGAGAARERLAEMPNVSVVDWIPKSEVPALMQKCGYVSLPSRWRETWGLVVPEALAAGRPVIVSTMAGSAELVEKFGGGVTFDPMIEGDLSRVLRGANLAKSRDRYTNEAYSVPSKAGLWPELFAQKFVAIVNEAWPEISEPSQQVLSESDAS